MSAGLALQTAVVAALGGVPDIAGIYDGPPARAAYPYVVADSSTELDWSHKSGEGREIRVALTLWDDQPQRLHRIGDAIESAVDGVIAVADWTLVSLRFVRKRVVRDSTGPWAMALDYRARLLKS